MYKETDQFIKMLIPALSPHLKDSIANDLYKDNLCMMMIDVLGDFKNFLYEESWRVKITMEAVEWASNCDNSSLSNDVMICFLEGLFNSSLWEPEMADAVLRYMGEKTREQWSIFALN